MYRLEGLVSYGFGTVTGVVSREPASDLSQHPRTIWLVSDPLALSAGMIPQSVVAIVTTVSISAYSHAASSLWRLGVPVLCGVKETDLAVGRVVSIDFERVGSLAPGRGVLRESADGLSGESVRLLGEVESVSDLKHLTAADGLGILNVEDLEAIGWAASQEVLRTSADLGCSQPPIRFFDGPRPLDSSTTGIGHRGARLATQSRITEFKRILHQLHLAEAPTLVLPMYAHPWEFERFCELMSDITDRFGVTIETPEAALTFDEIASRCAFAEIGLNDLTQLTVAWDRDQPCPDLMPSESLTAGVGHLVAKALDAAVSAEVDCALGLDMRPSPRLAHDLVELGTNLLSCPAGILSHWRTALDGIT